jgi:hypothetical protein
MNTHRAFSKLCIVLLISLVAGLEQSPMELSQASRRSSWTLEGRVYAGEVGQETSPIPSVTVSLYGAGSAFPTIGTLLRATSTNSEGWYGLLVYDDDVALYDYFYLLESDPEGYHSVGATSVGGTVRTQNWIEYSPPFEGKVLTGNRFWDSPQPPPFDIPLEDVPPAYRRPGAQLLENVRGSEDAPGWDTARIGPVARPLYRPDVPGIAYYEFEVLVDSQAAGYIVTSTGDHDYPVAHWSFAGSTPTRELELLASQEGKQPAKFYKLDTLSYAVEDAAGGLIAAIPFLPLKVSGMQMAWLDQPVELTEEQWIPDHAGEDDNTPPTGGERKVSGPTESPVQLSAWQSWQEMKSGYNDAYEVLAEKLRRDASYDWEIENLAHEFGEGLHVGDTYRLALLCQALPEITLNGPGAALISTNLQERTGMPPLYTIHVDQAPQEREAPFDVEVACPGGLIESFKFWVIGAPTGIHLPLMVSGSASQDSETKPQRLAPTEPNRPEGFARYWTWGYIADQRWYTQTSFYPPPTISSCPSGCGATAWALVLGWADYQANTWEWKFWSKNWGIFRPNGGYSGDTRAPQYMTSGVKNMIWEIRDDIDTWCTFGSAPTYPSDMDEVSDYLVGRSNVRIDTHYNVFGWRESRLRRYVANSIIYRLTPAVIGTGWLSHYPVASAYRWWSRDVKKCFLWWCWWKTEYNRQFWVNQGWGQNSSQNGWIPAGTWFAGEIYPSGQ